MENRSFDNDQFQLLKILKWLIAIILMIFTLLVWFSHNGDPLYFGTQTRLILLIMTILALIALKTSKFDNSPLIVLLSATAYLTGTILLVLSISFLFSQ